MKSNPWSWNEAANVIWVDQPIGVGYSSQGNDLVQDERQVGERMFAFLQNFYAKYPHFLSVPLFITGESYSGHYVPAVAARVLRGQGQGVGALRGIAIGNGEVDPAVQWASKPIMAFTGGVGGSLHKGVINFTVFEQMTHDLVHCEKDIHACQEHPQPMSCMTAMGTCAMSLVMPVRAEGINLYDLRKPCTSPLTNTDPATALCYNYTAETAFLNDPDVKETLGVPRDRVWSSCNMTSMIPFLLSGDYLHNYRRDVSELLAGGVNVLIYAGDTDFQVDWIGCRAWVENLPWAHQKEWNAAPQVPVVMGGHEHGLRQSAYGLTYIQVFNAGHMVPMDQPEFALAMLRNLMNQRPMTAKFAGSSSKAPFFVVAGSVVALAAVLTTAAVLARRGRKHEREAYLLMA